MVKTKSIKKEKVSSVKPERYIEALGGRKTAHARVRLYDKQKTLIINGKDYKEYFKIPKHQMIVSAPLKLVGVLDKMGITVKVIGGGIGMQAEAVRHGLSRALVLFNEEFKKRLRQAGFVTRDARSVERKKYGLKKARRAPQWQKR
mgnify:CR=1 FL=1